jgi:uncharacterized SAM-binding protein YcdF (DUF218 family)
MMAALPPCLLIFAASMTSRWAHFTHTFAAWLTNPWLVSMALVTLIVVSLIFGSRYWRRQIRRGAIALLLAYWIAVSPPVAALAVDGLTTFLPPASQDKADAIVVLTRGGEVEGDRYQLAVTLWQEQRAPKIFVTSARNVRKTRLLLEKQNLPITALGGTLCAITTLDEATSTAAILGPQGVKSIILVTDPPHLLRASLTFESFGFQVMPQASPLPPTLSSAGKTIVALREYSGLVSYAILGRFRQRPAEQLAKPPVAIAQEVARRNCKLRVIPNPESS